METHNRYSPPASDVADAARQPASRSIYGFGLSASLFWRIFVLQAVVGMPAVVLLRGSSLAATSIGNQLLPSLVYSVMVAFMAASLLVFRPGLLFLVWGNRLNLGVRSWRVLGWGYCGLFLALAILNAAVAITASVETWVTFKAFGPLIGAVGFCLVTPRVLPKA